MGRKKDLSSGKKHAIVALLKTKNHSYREIAKMEKVSRSSINNLAKILQSGGTFYDTKRRNCGGIRKTTPRTDRKIIQLALEKRRTTASELQKQLSEEGIKISAMTLRRRLYENNLKCRRPAKKPRLTEKMQKKRLIWAKLHQHWTVDDWKKVIFSDECRLEAVTESAQFVRRRPGERFSEACVVRSIKHPPSVMIWSCISGDGPGPIYFVEETMRKEQYKKVLTDVLFPYMRSLPQGQSSYTFMQDGAPCHTAKLIENVLLNQNIDILSWPGNSPDLNPIENCWALLKSNVYKTPNPTVSTLKKILKKYGTIVI